MEVVEAIRRCKTENSAPIPDLRPLNFNCRVGPDANPRVLAWLMERALKNRTACSRQTPGLTLRFPFRDRGAAPLKLQISYLGCAAFGASGELEVCYRAETVAYRRFSPFGGVAGLFRPVFHGNPGICACGHRARRNGNPRIRARGHRPRRDGNPGIRACGYRTRRDGNPGIRACGHRARRDGNPGIRACHHLP